MYRLKTNQPEFQVTREGSFEYHTFKHGEIYEKVPPEEIHRFDPVKDITPAREEDAKSHRGSSKKGGNIGP
jgi:hypothetical protein